MASASSKRMTGDSKHQVKKKYDRTLLSSCEPEIQELLRQVDLLLESKKSEWESKVAGLQKQLQRRDGELNALRAALQCKSTEVERLQARTDAAEKYQEEQTKIYEVQLTTMKSELSRLSRKHEKLQSKREHQMEDAEKERLKVSEECRTANRELQHIRKAFEELHAKSLLWDKEKGAVEKRLEQAVAENEAIRSRSVYLEECSATHQRDLERYKRLQLNSEQTHKLHIAQLEAKLKLNEQGSQSREDSIGRMKSAIEEALSRVRQKSSECERLHSELANSKDSAEKLKKENLRLQKELQQRDHHLRSVQSTRLKLTREMAELRESLRSKDDVITTLEEHRQSDGSPETTQTRSDLKRSQSTVRTLTVRQKKLQEGLKEQQQLAESYKEQCASLKNQLSYKEESLQTSHAKLLELRDSEIRKLQLRAQKMDTERHTLLDDSSKLRTELAEKEATNARLSAQLNAIEQQNRTRQAVHKRQADDLKMANSQLEVLRRENQRLCEAADNSMLSQHDLAAGENLLEMNSQLQNGTISVLEDQNNRLQSKVVSLESSLARFQQKQNSPSRSDGGLQNGVEASRSKSDIEDMMSGQTPVEVSDTEHLVLASDDKQSSSSERSSAHLSTNQAERLNGESEAVPVGIHDHRSVIVSSADPPGPKDSEAELDISVSSLSPVTGSQPGSPVSLLSSDSQWSLSEVVTGGGGDVDGVFQINELETIIDAKISEFRTDLDNNDLEEFDQ